MPHTSSNLVQLFLDKISGRTIARPPTPPQGPPGGTTNGFTFTQSTPSTTWIAVHSLASEDTIVQIYDSSRNLLIPDNVVVTNVNTITITFSANQTGFAQIIAL